MASSRDEEFKAHVRSCSACKNQPVDREWSPCSEGASILASQGEGAHVTTEIEDDDPDTEVVGRLFGLPMVRVKVIDRNRLYLRYCKHDPLCKGHLILTAMNTTPIGIMVGVTMWDGSAADDGLVQGRRFMAPKEARQFFKEINDRATEIGYTLMWHGETLFDTRGRKD